MTTELATRDPEAAALAQTDPAEWSRQTLWRGLESSERQARRQRERQAAS